MNKKIKILFIGLLFFLIKDEIIKEIYIKVILKNHIIISLTSSKDSMKSYLLENTIKSLLNQTLIPYKIIISINNKDSFYISDFIKIYINKNFIEIVRINEDLKGLNKYYYIPDIYTKYILIVINDNIIFEKNTIENLYRSYELNPNCISARRVFKMNFYQNWKLKPFYLWDKDYKLEKHPKFSLFAIHGDGALFPPNTLEVTKLKNLLYFKKIFDGHDFVIKYFELKQNLKTVYVVNSNDYQNYSYINTNDYEKYNNLLIITPNEVQLSEDFKNVFIASIYKNIKNEKVVIPQEIKKYYLTNKNKNTINNETLLVSMTTSPSRIYEMDDVFISLLYQTIDSSAYQIVLTLAIEEFINKEKDLPFNIQKLLMNGWIKLIWYHNINSHKKLFPIIQLYPDNDILIVEDNIIRTKNFIEIFVKDHKKYPKDIICGNFKYFYNNKFEIKSLKGYLNKINKEINAVPNIIFQTAFPLNGEGGIFYPKHTFSDKRFFNESLYMKLSPISGEAWQYVFNIIEKKVLRQTSVIIDNSVNLIEDNYKNKEYSYITDKNNINLNNIKLMNFFPEYKTNSIERLKKIIISLTSYKFRLKNLNLIIHSILNNTMKPSKIILTLFRDDQKYLTKEVQEMINNKIIELIITDKDLKSHKKYFYAMKEYRDYAIITIDDDIIYTNDLIESLYNSYIENPNCIHARRVHKIMTINNKILPYENWLMEYTFELNPSFDLFATLGGGTLFPPNILNISDENIKEIYKCITSDDIYIKYLSRKNNIKIVWVPNKFPMGLGTINDKKNENTPLFKINVQGKKLNDYYLKIFPII